MKRALFAALVLPCLLLVPSCGGGDGDGPTDPAGPDTADLDGYLDSLPTWQEFSPQLTAVGDPEDVVTGPTEATLTDDDGVLYVCRSTPCSITNTPDAIVTMNPNSEILFLGALIQGSTYLGGLAAMEELPIRQRAPLTITTDLLVADNSRTIEDPDVASVGEAVGELITAAQNAGHTPGSALSYNKQECYSLEQSMLDMGMSMSYLGASVSAELSFEQSVEQHTIMATFRERMFTTSVVLPQTPSELFSDDFTQADLDAQVDLGRIGPDNLPVYVSNIVWGRIMVFTMTSTYSTSEMETAITASYDGLVSGDGHVDYTHIFNSEQTTINMVAVGGEASHALAAIQSGNLRDYFSSEAALTSAAPLSYTLRNLADNSVALVSETTAYDMVECSTDIVAIHHSYDQWHNAVLDLTGEVPQIQVISSTEMVDADEVDAPLGNNREISGTLTFPGSATGLDLDFVLRSMNSTFTFNDTEFDDGWQFPHLSPGDVDNAENDDVSITIVDAVAPMQVLAAGLYIADNAREAGEEIRVYGESDRLLATFAGEEGMPHYGGWAFRGVIAAVPIYRVEFDEHSGGDDICIKDPTFGLISE